MTKYVQVSESEPHSNTFSNWRQPLAIINTTLRNSHQHQVMPLYVPLHPVQKYGLNNGQIEDTVSHFIKMG